MSLTIRQTVFSDLDVGLVRNRLIELPGEIIKAKEAIVEIEVKLKYDGSVKEAKQVVVDIEVEMGYEVWSDVDENGKKKFTNEVKRKEETRRRLVLSEGYIRHQNNVANMLRTEAAMKLDLGKAHASFAAIEAENHNLRSIAAMIAGLAHESTTTTTHRHETAVRFADMKGDN